MVAQLVGVPSFEPVPRPFAAPPRPLAIAAFLLVTAAHVLLFLWFGGGSSEPAPGPATVTVTLMPAREEAAARKQAARVTERLERPERPVPPPAHKTRTPLRPVARPPTSAAEPPAPSAPSSSAPALPSAAPSVEPPLSSGGAPPAAAEGGEQPGASAGTAPTAGGEGVGEAGASQPAAYAHNPKPPYPLLSRRLGEEGMVKLSVLVAADGSVAEVTVAKSSGYPRLDRAALETVQTTWRFAPARADGRPVAARVIVPIEFKLEP